MNPEPKNHEQRDAPDPINAQNSGWRFLESRAFRSVLYGVLTLIVLLLVFRTGMIIGYQKALSSFQLGQNYDQIFLGPDNGPRFGLDGDGFPNDHGSSGQIIQISGDTVVLKGRDQVERSVVTDDDTLIKRFQDTVSLSALKVGDDIIVIGSPNDSGQLEAKFIRYLPAPPPLQKMPPEIPAGAVGSTSSSLTNSL